MVQWSTLQKYETRWSLGRRFAPWHRQLILHKTIKYVQSTSIKTSEWRCLIWLKYNMKKNTKLKFEIKNIFNIFIWGFWKKLNFAFTVNVIMF